MDTITITGQDTFTLFDRVLNDFADGDASTITFPEDLANLMTGKDGNSIISENAKGINADVVLRIIKNSSDDQFLQQKLNLARNDFAAQTLATGQFVKRTGDGAGNIKRDVYDFNGGFFQRNVDARENVAGETEQGVSVYRLKFARGKRVIQ